MTIERQRIEDKDSGHTPWLEWGPYLAERQWGTVREDYSPDGAAWEYVPYEASRSRAYRWGEDGIGGISDSMQRLCFAFAFWNRRDDHIKERLFGVTGNQGNHGEDVKELYYYIDSTPTHSYMKMLYKYPQLAFPYEELVDVNERRGKSEPEFELLDTGILKDNEYFDIVIEYAKASWNDILVKITAFNRGTATAPLEILPHLWFRNTWSWKEKVGKPALRGRAINLIEARHDWLGTYRLYAEDPGEALFCDNETNPSLYGIEGKGTYKDGINNYIIDNKSNGLNQNSQGTKCALRYSFDIPPAESKQIRLRLSLDGHGAPFDDFDTVFSARVEEADRFYDNLQGSIESDDDRQIQRQALAGTLWTKQFYYYDVRLWLHGDPGHPEPAHTRLSGRNHEWDHLENFDIISMPDKWEYPWYAAWDLAFHCLPLCLLDSKFAKKQLLLMVKERYMHPNGQLPAHEWGFSDVNPPVHAWATWRVYQIDRRIKGGAGDRDFLERVFHKLLINFTWWVNRKDEQGRNLFQGGFLGLDNIGVFDRGAPLPTGGFINQSDGTSWMAMYSLNMMRIAIELALKDRVYEDIAIKFFEHFLHISEAMTNIAGKHMGLWDEEDKFYYDAIHLPDGEVKPVKLRSIVGLIPLFAVEVLEPETLKQLPVFHGRLKWLMHNRPDLASLVSRWEEPGRGKRRLLSLLRGHRMKCLLKRMLDSEEFLSDYGIRALSRHYHEHPYEFELNGHKTTVRYQPAESDTTFFGGNSNWRGPIWFPVNYLIIESLHRFHHYYGDDFKIEHPTGSGNYITIKQVAHEISERLINIFRKNEEGERPVYNHNDKLQHDPHFRDHILFYEYFHGDNGRGVGASHQTGWTGLVATLIRSETESLWNPKEFC